MTNVNISTLLLCILVLYFKDKSPPRTNQLPEKLKYHRIVLGKLNYYWPFNFIFSLDDETLITGPDHLLSLSIYNQNYRKNKVFIWVANEVSIFREDFRPF